MRGFVLVVLLVGLFGWWSGWFAGGAIAAAPKDGTQSTPAGGQPLGSVLDHVAGGQPAVAPQEPLDANAKKPTVAGLDELVARLGQRTPESLGAAWAVVATANAADKQRVLQAMPVPGDDFPSLFGVLGQHNAFLHSAEGRGIAQRAVAAAMALADAEAMTAGTQLLNLMLRGRIELADEAARKFVDETWRQHRVRVDRWLCDPANVTGARSYTIAGGDSLARIAAKFRREKLLVEDGTLAILNRIHNPNSIKAGQKIKVPQAAMHTVVEKRSFSIAVYLGEHLLRLYWIGHGENDRTPVAEFTVDTKLPRPEWTAPDGQVYAYGHPKNILGEYFIKLLSDTYVGFGIHGTPFPHTICTMSSMGCVRMHAVDIDELFRLLPKGTKVAVKATESLR